MNMPRRFAWLWACVLAVAAAGCATTAVDAQWRNLDLSAAYLRGAAVLVACDAPELVLQRLCEDRLTTELAARGARPLLAPPVPPAGVADLQHLPAARERGAKAVLGISLGLASQAVSPGVALSIGGFGFGRGAGGGIGVTAPLGGGQVSSGYGANARVTDVASERLMWTARAAAPPSSDLGAQVGALVKAVVDAAAGAGLF